MRDELPSIRERTPSLEVESRLLESDLGDADENDIPMEERRFCFFCDEAEEAGAEAVAEKAEDMTAEEEVDRLGGWGTDGAERSGPLDEVESMGDVSSREGEGEGEGEGEEGFACGRGDGFVRE
jgi:hypothetical protein